MNCLGQSDRYRCFFVDIFLLYFIAARKTISWLHRVSKNFGREK